MTIVDFYQYLLFFLVTVFTFRTCKKYQGSSFSYANVNTKVPDSVGIVLCFLFTILIGNRILVSPPYFWVDTGVYCTLYDSMLGGQFYLDFTTENKIFDNLHRFWASYDLGMNSLFVICDAIYFGCTYKACQKWFPHDTTVAYLAFLGAFSTYSYSWNGVKAGVAAALFLVAIACYQKKTISICFVLLSWGFHHSMTVPVAAYALTLFYKNPKWYFYGWSFCAFMSALHITAFAELFASISGDEIGKSYLLAQGGEGVMDKGGFRLDFIIYSIMPVWVGYKIVMKEGLKVSKEYLTLLHMYLCTNGVWMLCMYASYSNRIAYLSWFMYPFVLIYPFLKEDLKGMSLLGTRNQYMQLTKVVKYHLYFTLFMELIFYKLIKVIVVQ